MDHPEKLVVFGIFIGFALIEAARTGFFRKDGATRGDLWADVISYIFIPGLIAPTVLLVSFELAARVAPQYENALAGAPWWAALGLFLIFDDMMQYWWHRASHTFPFLYNLHRAHHSAEYMSVRIVYRNNLFYYMMMPSLWFDGVLIYLGLGWAYVGFIIVKMGVIIGAHSDFRWDEKLYSVPALRPLMWVVERVISTPSTHAMHHGRHASDGVTHYKGNYGNLLFFWDVLFGTAKISRAYPPAYGIENLEPISWKRQIFWPVIR